MDWRGLRLEKKLVLEELWGPDESWVGRGGEAWAGEHSRTWGAGPVPLCNSLP